MTMIAGQKFIRTLEIGDTIDEDARTVELSISSEFPVKRYDGNEILVHSKEAIDMSRFPLPLIVSHERWGRLNIGLLESPVIAEKKLRVVARFGERTEADEIWKDVRTGIIRFVSVGYIVQATDDADKETYKVTRWMPYEGSLVSVPADVTVGVGRSLDFDLDAFSRMLETGTPEQRKYLIERVSTLVKNWETDSPGHDDGGDDDNTPDERGQTLRRELEIELMEMEEAILTF